MLRRVLVGVGSRVRKIMPKKKTRLIKVRKICVFKPGAIGDVLMTTPFLKALRQRFPNAQIDYWVGKNSAFLLAKNQNINRVITFDEHNALGKRAFRMLALAQKVHNTNYDVMFMLDFSYLANVFAAACRVPVTIGFDRGGEGFPLTLSIPYGKVKHQIEYYLDLAYLVGAKRITEPRMEFKLSTDDMKFAEQFFKKHKLNPARTIAIAPGGARNLGQDMPSRRWPAERFAQIAQKLAEQGWQMLLIGRSPGDDEPVPAMLNAAPKAVNAIGNFNYRQSAALMRLSRLLICNDSGPMHVAAAIGTPTVSIFGPTDPRRKAPLGAKHLWLWNPVNNTYADAYADYKDPRLIRNILKVTPGKVLNAVNRLVHS